MHLGIVLTLSRGLSQPSSLSDLCEHASGLELRSVARISALRVCQVSRQDLVQAQEVLFTIPNPECMHEDPQGKNRLVVWCGVGMGMLGAAPSGHAQAHQDGFL